MSQYLEMLEKMKDIQIVKFFSQFYSESTLAPLFRDLQDRAEQGAMGGLAKALFVWALILAVGAFVIDQAFFWTRPGQIDMARDTWQGVKDGVISLKDAVRTLVARTMTARRGDKETPSGRR